MCSQSPRRSMTNRPTLLISTSSDIRSDHIRSIHDPSRLPLCRLHPLDKGDSVPRRFRTGKRPTSAEQISGTTQARELSNMTSPDWQEVMKQAQERAKNLATLMLTLVSISVVAFAFVMESRLDDLMARDAALWFVAVVHLLALVVALGLTLVAKSFVVPAPNNRKSGACSSATLDLFRYCAENTAKWNRVRQWAFVLVFYSLIFLVLIVGQTSTADASTDTSTDTRWLYLVAAGIVLMISLISLAMSCRLMFGTYSKKQKCYLRHGLLFDLDGYRPKDICGCGMPNAASPHQADDETEISPAS